MGIANFWANTVQLFLFTLISHTYVKDIICTHELTCRGLWFLNYRSQGKNDLQQLKRNVICLHGHVMSSISYCYSSGLRWCCRIFCQCQDTGRWEALWFLSNGWCGWRIPAKNWWSFARYEKKFNFDTLGVCAVIANPVQPQALNAILGESFTSAAPNLRGLHYFDN